MKLFRRRGTPEPAQVVQLGAYAYIWHGTEPLRVGDRVAVPSWDGTGEQIKTVTGLGTDYDGPLKSVLRKVE